MADLLVEIRCEELPAKRVRDAAAALRDGLGAALETAGLLAPGVAATVPILGTPRRLAAFLPGVTPRLPDAAERLWGPPVAAGRDAGGKPTKAGEGFARNAGVPFEALGSGEKIPGKPPYLYADRVLPGRTAAGVVAEALPGVAAGLPFRRTMRWPGSAVPFARPVRGLVVLLGDEVVPVEFAGVVSSRRTRGHAFLAPEEFDVPAADLDGYRDRLRAAKVVVDWEERTALVREEVLARWRECGVPDGAALDPSLLEEVTGLVERPAALVGTFDAAYRDLPQAVLVTSMAHHLRYFPVPAAGGGLDHRFVSVMDREPGSADAVRPGNERVLRARLYDAAFFHRNDRRRRLEEFRPGLAGMDFHRGLGTLLEKSDRVRTGIVSLSDTLGLSAAETAAADRAALLLKCDLLTEVVREFTELQGVVGADYARKDGEEEAVAAALEAQYLPAGISLGSVVDRNPVAAVVCLADKLDTLSAYFSIGEEPTGSSDPFGLRRAALATLHILRRRADWAVPLDDLVAPSASAWRLTEAVRARLLSFLWTRADQMARDDGKTDFVDCIGPATDRPIPEYGERLGALASLATHGNWGDLVKLVERTGNMGMRVEGDPGAEVSLPPEALEVRERLAVVAGKAPAARVPRAVDLVLFADIYQGELGPAVHAMFEKVLVEDPAFPERRAAIKAMLHDIHHLFADRLGDLRRLGSGAKPTKA